MIQQNGPCRVGYRQPCASMAVVVADVLLQLIKTPKVKVSRLTIVTLPLPRGGLGSIRPHLDSHRLANLLPPGIGVLL